MMELSNKCSIDKRRIYGVNQSRAAMCYAGLPVVVVVVVVVVVQLEGS